MDIIETLIIYLLALGAIGFVFLKSQEPSKKEEAQINKEFDQRIEGEINLRIYEREKVLTEKHNAAFVALMHERDEAVSASLKARDTWRMRAERYESAILRLIQEKEVSTASLNNALKLTSKHNLCTFFLLPLIGINQFSFGAIPNFKNCYSNRKGTELYVSVYYTLTTLKSHPRLLRIEGKPGAPIYVFELPEQWHPDFRLYKLGKYTMFSQKAKEMIYENSGLAYKQLNAEGKTVTDFRLHAIDNSKERGEKFRKRIIELRGGVVSEDAEILGPPPDSSYATSPPFKLCEIS